MWQIVVFIGLVILILVGWLAGPRIWLFMAYERQETPGQFYYYDKREGALPGQDRIVPDQICPFCASVDRTKKHSCLVANSTTSSGAKPNLRTVQVSGVDLPPEFRCTCPGPHY